MKKLYFIRHGLTVMNEEGVWSTYTDTPLTDTGRQQALDAGKSAKAMNIQIDVIVSSPMERALETVQIVAKEIGYPIEKILTNPLLVERNAGALEGAVYKHGIPKEGIEGYEQDPELIARARKALDWIENLEADNILIAAHGGIGRALRSLVKEDFPMSHPHQLKNAQLYEWL